VLLVAPTPAEKRLVDTDAEIDAVMHGLRLPEYDVEVVAYPSSEVLRHSMESEPPNVLHFIGHGGINHGEGSLILQNPDGRSRWVSATELAGILPVSVRLVCLSSPVTTENYQILGLCHLARAAGLVALPTVVTNQYPVGFAGAEAFWAAFYGALLNRRGNVNDAVHDARRATYDAVGDYADWGSFSLIVRDQTGVSFDLGRSVPETERRQSIELAAQFASQLANDLAQQVTSLGDDAPAGLREQFEVEHLRAERFLDDLAE
jgi:CHAT domain-containing protein